VSADPTATDTAWVGLGSNLGHRGRNLARLRDALSDNDVKIVAGSPEILTRPVGVTAQGDFHNQVVRLRSPAPWQPRMWAMHCKAAEVAAGRRPTYRWGPRIADADILELGEDGGVHVTEDDLVVPHPELVHRPFLLELLAEAGFRAAGSAQSQATANRPRRVHSSLTLSPSPRYRAHTNSDPLNEWPTPKAGE
jgi:2-amino-4-hydroxy-6-hydroxymethyldihydropteridine diphosphokinase